MLLFFVIYIIKFFYDSFTRTDVETSLTCSRKKSLLTSPHPVEIYCKFMIVAKKVIRK